MTHAYDHPRPALTVDCVVFGISPGASPELQVLLIERADEPFADRWALPGGFVRVSDDAGQGEDLEDAARRELTEETGLQVEYLEQLYTFGAPGRDPRGRVVSVAYWALVRSSAVAPGSDASKARWFAVGTTPALAFDHDAILRTAVERLRAKVRYAPVGFHLLPPKFTLAELQHLYEAILQRRLDRPNFRRRILGMSILAEAGRQKGVRHRAATMYRFDGRAYARAVREGVHFEV